LEFIPNEWVICEKLIQDVKILTEQIDNLLSKHSNDTLSRKFIMKIQLQTIRRKDKELKEFATKINQLQKENNELQADIDEHKSLAEQWQNPDLTQVFSPDTITTFENIIAQCETNLVSTNNDTNPEMEISDEDIEMISQYLNFDNDKM
jgi:seryl-tRNA synthetase